MLKNYIFSFFADIYILKQLTKSIHLFSVTTEQATNLRRVDSECQSQQIININFTFLYSMIFHCRL